MTGSGSNTNQAEMSTHQQHVTAAADRVPWHQLIAYGMGGLIPVALFNIAGQLMGLLGNISLGLSAFWLGTIMIIPRLWDAVSDPVMGHISDNTRTRWGRRRPYILFGGIAVALSFVAMWWIPRGDFVMAWFPSETAYNWFQLAFILVGLLVFFTACTVFEIPHGALGMEMSGDYRERTRLFGAKSSLGNLFAMGTPWLLFLAGLEFFRGPGGDLAEGMRYVSIIIAAVLVPMAFWWFFALREPGFAVAKEQKRSAFWTDMRTALSNKVFLSLVVIIFTLAMGFNFVSLFGSYITIFYLYRGDAIAAVSLLAFAASVWAATGFLAVFPLNWLSRRFEKNKTLLIAILLMCVAQLAKIVCYNPELPYLILIPTVLLSAGMMMFFTLGSSMVGDVCDEDELKTGTRSEGSYYAVFWWFIKMGSALASFVTGVLLVLTSFDETQNVIVDSLRSTAAVVQADAESWSTQDVDHEGRLNALRDQLGQLTADVTKLDAHLAERATKYHDQAAHLHQLAGQLQAVAAIVDTMKAEDARLVSEPATLIGAAEQIRQHVGELSRQAPATLFRLRAIEIGLPLLLSCVSVLLTLRYPLTEARCYEIKRALDARHAELRT